MLIQDDVLVFDNKRSKSIDDQTPLPNAEQLGDDIDAGDINIDSEDDMGLANDQDIADPNGIQVEVLPHQPSHRIVSQVDVHVQPLNLGGDTPRSSILSPRSDDDSDQPPAENANFSAMNLSAAGVRQPQDIMSMKSEKESDDEDFDPNL